MTASFDICAYQSGLSEYAHGKILHRPGVSVAGLTTFKIGGECAVLVEPKNADEMAFALRIARRMNIKTKVLGRGSNILCSDDGYDGVILLSEGMDGIKIEGECVECGAGLSLTALSNELCEAGLVGGEFMYGIPGTVGGGVFMNAGAYGGQMSDVVFEVDYYDADEDKIKTLMSDELDFSYRHSFFSRRSNCTVLTVRMRFERGERDAIYAKMRDLISRRREKQPLEFASAGSTFKRGEGYFAAALIDDTGLKGVSVGGAQVSEKHAGFIINRGDASAKDVLALIGIVKERVYKKHGVTLECEVEYLD